MYIYHLMIPRMIQDHQTPPNTTIYNMTMSDEPLFNSARTLQLRLLGHILRLPDKEPARRYALLYTISWQKVGLDVNTHCIWPTFNNCYGRHQQHAPRTLDCQACTGSL